MPAPSPKLVVENPPPLNPFSRFPFFVNEFPADWLLVFGSNVPKENVTDPEPNANRREAR